MTNTPMTREAFEQFVKSDYDHNANLKTENYETVVYKDDDVEIMWMAWQASQAQQAQTIAEWEKLKDANVLHTNLLRGFPAKLSDEQLLHLLGSEHPVNKQAQTIAELVEALEDADEMIGIEPFEHVAQEAADAHRNIRTLIAKVKGK